MYFPSGAVCFVETAVFSTGDLHDAAVDRGSGLDSGVLGVDGFEAVDTEYILVDAWLQGADRDAPDSVAVALHGDFGYLPLSQKQCDLVCAGRPQPEGN